MHVHVYGHKLRHSTRNAILLQGLDVAIDHGQELQGIQLLSVVLDLNVKHVGRNGHHLSGLHLRRIVGEDIAEVGIGHLVLAIADDLVDTVDGIVAESRHLACGDG